MDDIEALHRHLDRVPDDHTARLVLADRLEEAGSPLAEGYRALGIYGRRPRLDGQQMLWCWSWTTESTWPQRPYQTFPWCIPRDWWRAMRGDIESGHRGIDQPSRREAEDAAAMAFARLPESRRRELLAKLYGG